jgi:hypothetical protein
MGRAALEKQGGGDSKRDTGVFHANLERFLSHHLIGDSTDPRIVGEMQEGCQGMDGGIWILSGSSFIARFDAAMTHLTFVPHLLWITL